MLRKPLWPKVAFCRCLNLNSSKYFATDRYEVVSGILNGWRSLNVKLQQTNLNE